MQVARTLRRRRKSKYPGKILGIIIIAFSLALGLYLYKLELVQDNRSWIDSDFTKVSGLYLNCLEENKTRYIYLSSQGGLVKIRVDKRVKFNTPPTGTIITLRVSKSQGDIKTLVRPQDIDLGPEIYSLQGPWSISGGLGSNGLVRARLNTRQDGLYKTIQGHRDTNESWVFWPD